jgi:hypothetical protein
MDQATLKEWLSYDPETGVFTWAQNSVGKIKTWRRAGCLHQDGYIKIRLFDKMYRCSRLAVLYMTGEMPGSVDHVNRDRADDRWANLRVCTRSQNQYNRPIQGNNKSGFKGVFWNKQQQKWQAKIGYQRRQKHLGFFDLPEEAGMAYKHAAEQLHAEFACV